MYCSSCGMAVAQGLSYCKHCGAKLSGAKSDNVTKSSEVKPALLVSAMVGLFIFGLLAIGVLISAMKENVGFDLSIIFAVTVFSLILLLGVEGTLIRLLLKSKRGAKDVGDRAAKGANDSGAWRGAEASASGACAECYRTYYPRI